MRLKCYYETDSFYDDNTQRIIDSAIEFFSSNETLKKTDRVGYKNFISIFNKLYKTKAIADKRSRNAKLNNILPRIKNQLSELTTVKEKLWLLRQIERFE